MRYDSEHKAQTRKRVLHEAAAAIRAGGTERVGVAAIMGRSGLTQGGFYAHFKSKDDLIAEAIAYMFDERYAHFLSHLDTPDPRSALGGFIDSYLSMRHRNAPERGCPIPALASELPRLSEGARERFDLGLKRLTGGLTRLLRDMDMHDAEAKATSAIAEMVGALALSRAHSNDEKATSTLAMCRASLKERFGIEAIEHSE